MALPSSGTITLNQIKAEFGGANNLLDYLGASTGIPTNPPLKITDFYGAANGVLDTYVLDSGATDEFTHGGYRWRRHLWSSSGQFKILYQPGGDGQFSAGYQVGAGGGGGGPSGSGAGAGAIRMFERTYGLMVGTYPFEIGAGGAGGVNGTNGARGGIGGQTYCQGLGSGNSSWGYSSGGAGGAQYNDSPSYYGNGSGGGGGGGSGNNSSWGAYGNSGQLARTPVTLVAGWRIWQFGQYWNALGWWPRWCGVSRQLPSRWWRWWRISNHCGQSCQPRRCSWRWKWWKWRRRKWFARQRLWRWRRWRWRQWPRRNRLRRMRHVFVQNC